MSNKIGANMTLLRYFMFMMSPQHLRVQENEVTCPYNSADTNSIYFVCRWNFTRCSTEGTIWQRWHLVTVDNNCT